MANFFEQFHQQEEPKNFFSQFHTDEVDLPEQVAPQTTLPKPGTYTQDDMVENDQMFSIIQNYMADRYGPLSMEGQDKTAVVDSFLNNRRGVASGNSVRALSEIDYINDISEDSGKMGNAAAAAALYENMAGLFSKETTFAERAEGVMDFTRSAIADPINLVGGFIGKAVGQGALRVGTNQVKKNALKKMSQAAIKKGATQETVKKAGQEAIKLAVKESGEVVTKEVAEYTTRIMSSKGFKRLATKGALAEIGTTVGIDAAVGAGTEYLYQSGLIKLGVREDFDKYSMGFAALGATVLGGIQAGRIALRGSTSPVAPSIAVKQPKADDVLLELANSIGKYGKAKVKKSTTWEYKVSGGIELKDLDSQFFVDLLLGHVDKKGNVVLKGFAEIAQEKGLIWSTRFEGDKYANWMADVIKKSKPKQINDFIKAFEKATGNKLKDAKKLTVAQFATTFALKINQSASILNALSQGSKRNGISAADMTVDDLVKDAMDAGYLPKPKDPLSSTLSDKIPEVIRNNQNRVIRLLVSNPSTSALNLIGYGANAGMGMVSDMVLATLHAGRGTMAKLIGMQEAGNKSYRIASTLIQSNASRITRLFDPDMTYAAFESALSRNSEALQKLSNTLPGGIENTTRLLTDSKISPEMQMLGLKTDQAIDVIQTLSFVKAQDRFTKSQEFLFQMDKALRTRYGKGWNDFYSGPEAAKLMAKKDYRELETTVVEKTLESIFSKSYKGTDTIGQVAGIIEDARNIPGIGLLVPFGRFFNSTVDFGLQASGMSLVGKSMGKYQDKTTLELISKGAVGLGLAASMVHNEYENRRKGLKIFQTEDPLTGEVINQQYDFPISLLKAKARVMSYYAYGETPPKELIATAARDFSLSGLLRNLNRTQADVVSMTSFILQGENKEALRSFIGAMGSVAVQPVAGGTRFIEPLNVAVGTLQGEDARPIDRYQGNKTVNDMVKYFDNLIPLFVGESKVDVLGSDTIKSAAAGKGDITSTKPMGIRTVRLTDTQRVMNMMGYEQFDLNAARKIRQTVPKAANEYNGILFDIIEAESGALMSSKGFRKMSTQDQRRYWKSEVLPKAKSLAKSFLALQYSGASDTLDLQFQLSQKYTRTDLNNAIEELNFEGDEDLGDLNRGQLFLVQQYLDTVDNLKLLQVPSDVGALRYLSK